MFLLTTEGANVQYTTTVTGREEGRCPLHAAALGGHAEVTSLLLAKGADLNQTDKGGTFPLHLATLDGAKAMSELLARGICAAPGGHTEVATLLLAKGADVNQTDKDGFCPIHCAVFGGTAEMTTLLLAKGADVNQGKDGIGPISVAALSGNAEVISILLTKGANVNQVVEGGFREGAVPLHLAAEGGHVEVVTRLLQAGADKAVKDKSGKTALDIARDKNHPAVVALLQ